MTLSAFLLVFVAAICHATWNFLLKRISGGPELVWLYSVLSVVLYFPIAVAIIVLENPTFGWFEAIFYIGTAVLHLGYFLLLQQGYKRGELSLVYPTARATGPLLSSIFAVVILGEVFTFQIAAGGAAIILGIIFLTGGFRGNLGQLLVSITFGLGVGVLIGSYTVLDAHAVSVVLIPPLLLDYGSSLGRVICLSPFAVRRWDRITAAWRRHRLAILGIAVFNPLAYILVLIALQTTPIVFVAPVRELSVLFTVTLGVIFLGEGVFRSRMAWAMLIVAGVVVLATG